MKKYITLFCLMILFTNLMSQIITCRNSNSIKDQYFKNKFPMWKNNYETSALELLNSSTNNSDSVKLLTIENKIDLEEDYPNQVVSSNNLIYLFKLSHWSSENTAIINAFCLNQDGTGEEKHEIANVNNIKDFSGCSLKVSSSPDGQRIAILFQHPYKKGEKEKVAIFVFNRELDLLNSKTIEFKYQASRYKSNYILVNNLGEVYLSIGVKVNSNDFFKKRVIIKYNNNLQMIAIDSTQLKNEEISYTAKRMIDNNGNYVAAGLLYKGGFVTSEEMITTGFYSIRLNTNGSISKSVKSFNDGDKYLLNHLILGSNNNLYVLIESLRTRSSRNKELFYKPDVHHKNKNAFVLKITPNNKIDWEYEIQRNELKSINVDVEYNRFWMGLTDNKNLICLYKNNTYEKSDSINSISNTSVEVINLKGNLKNRISLGDFNQSKDCCLLPLTGRIIDDKIYFLGYSSKQELKSIEIELENIELIKIKKTHGKSGL